MTGETV